MSECRKTLMLLIVAVFFISTSAYGDQTRSAQSCNQKLSSADQKYGISKNDLFIFTLRTLKGKASSFEPLNFNRGYRMYRLSFAFKRYHPVKRHLVFGSVFGHSELVVARVPAVQRGVNAIEPFKITTISGLELQRIMNLDKSYWSNKKLVGTLPYRFTIGLEERLERGFLNWKAVAGSYIYPRVSTLRKEGSADYFLQNSEKSAFVNLNISCVNMKLLWHR